MPMCFFYHPDYTVGSGISPDRAKRLAGFTAGGESHPAPKNLKLSWLLYCNRNCRAMGKEQIVRMWKSWKIMVDAKFGEVLSWGHKAKRSGGEAK